MNIMAKLKSMQREIEALRARVEALEPEPAVPAVPWQTLFYDDPSKCPPGGVLRLKETIDLSDPIVAATIHAPARKRGRPPKA